MAKLKLLTLVSVLGFLLPPTMFPQAVDAPKLKVVPTGRMLLDGALYSGYNVPELFKAGVQMSDARLGIKAAYGKWNAKIDVAYAYGKVGLKDIYLQYNFDEENFIRAGCFKHQYGIQSVISSSRRSMMDAPVSNSVFDAPRQLGVMFEHSADKWLATLSLNVENQSMFLTPDQMGKEGYGVASRIIGRSIRKDGKILQFGISAGFATPEYHADEMLRHHSFTIGGNFPTRVCKVKALGATVDNALNQFKFSPEILLSHKRVALEAQYYFNRYNRRNHLHAFTGEGVYVAARGLLIGSNYKYNFTDGYLSSPGGGNLELTVGYNYTNLTCEKAGIRGGRVNNVSATLSYYINKYVTFRLGYSYTHRWDSSIGPMVDLSACQARLQVVF